MTILRKLNKMLQFKREHNNVNNVMENNGKNENFECVDIKRNETEILELENLC